MRHSKLAHVGIALGLGAALHLAAARGAAETRIANISQGTNIAIDASPGGEWLVVDLLGRLFRLPSSGGAAEPLTPDGEAARHPRFSPSGQHIVYQRLVDGQWDLWLLDAATGEREPLLATAANEREPDFTADGRAVVFVSDRGGSANLWRVELDSRVETQLTADPGQASFPAVSERDEILYVRRDADGWSLRVLLPSARDVELATTPHRLSAPTWRPGGGVVVYNEQHLDANGRVRSSELRMLVLSPDPVTKSLTRGEDVFASRAAWTSSGEYYYTADGRIWRRGIAHASREAVFMFAAVAVESQSPGMLDSPLDAAGPRPVRGTAGRSTSRDGDVEVVAALGDLWIGERRGRFRRLTDDTFAEIDPAVAPSGEFAVFASDRGGQMDLWHVALPSGVLTQLTRTPAKAFLPAVSPDGEAVAYLETDGLETLGSARLMTMRLDDRRPRVLAAAIDAPERLVWNEPDRVAVFVRERAGGGSAAGAHLTVDVSSGRVERHATGANVNAGAPHAHADAEPAAPLPIEWTPAVGEPFTLQVGRLFDGITGHYRRHVDVHVEGQRITAITGRDLGPTAARVIDARDATVIPGLIDVHAHQSSILGERLGRAWLAHGVTTVREVTGDIDRALERAEAWASGRRPGPRLVISPVSADGAEGFAQVSADTGDRAPLFMPIPVRRYSSLESAAALFGGASATFGPLAIEHPPSAAAAAALSPLRRSYDDVFNTLTESRTTVASSLGALGVRPGDSRALRRLMNHPAFVQLFTPKERAGWALDSPSPAAAAAENLVRLVRAGGAVAAGTESPLVPYGLGVHLELALLADAGLPNEQALMIATSGNALALGLETQLGTLEEGKLADFVVINGDPLRELAAALNIMGVSRGGVYIESSELTPQ